MNKKTFEFQKLEVYTKAKFLCKQMSQLIKISKFDNITKNQLRKISLNLVLHIAESTSRTDAAEQHQLFLQSKSNAYECAALMEHLHENEDIDRKIFHTFYFRLEEIANLLHLKILRLQQKVRINHSIPGYVNEPKPLAKQ